MKKVVIEKLGGFSGSSKYCVRIDNKKSRYVVFYSTEVLTPQQAFLECRDVGLALKTALGHKDRQLFFSDVVDASKKLFCDVSELKSLEVES